MYIYIYIYVYIYIYIYIYIRLIKGILSLSSFIDHIKINRTLKYIYYVT